MANPASYSVSFSFGGFQANSPSTPLPGSALDNELANVASAIAALGSFINDIRRSDGKLKNGIVTFDSFESGLQLLLDPTNGQLVAAAVAVAQAAAASAAGFNTSAGAHDTSAAASAGTVNLALYLAKSNNLAGLGSLPTSRANLGLGTAAVLDVGAGANSIVKLDSSAKIPAYDGSLLTGIDTVPIGTTIWVNDVVAPAGFIKENGSLISRASFPRLAAFALASSNIVSEATWLGGSFGAFSTGDLTTSFRIPDARGEFIRGYDDGRGVDSGRAIGAHQADSLKNHTHDTAVPAIAGANKNNGGGGGSFAAMASSLGTATSGSPSTGAAAETRPRNNAKLACIKEY